MTDSAAGGGEPTSPTGAGSTPGGGIGLDDVDDWTPADLAAEGDDNGGAGSGEPSRGGGMSDSNAAFADPGAADGGDAEGADSDQTPEEKAYADALKRLKLDGKSPEEIQRALAKAFWDSNNSGAKTARDLRQQNAELYAELEELRTGRGPRQGQGIDPANAPDPNRDPNRTPGRPQPPAPPAEAKPVDQDPDVQRIQTRVNQITEQRSATAGRMQQVANAAARTQEAVNVARYRLQDAPEDFRAQRTAEFRAAAQEHNALCQQYEALQARDSDYEQRLSDLQDRLQDATARAEERQRTQDQQARELRRWQSGQSHLFSNIVEQQMVDLNIPEEDRADFFEDVKARVFYTLKQMATANRHAPSVDLEQTIARIVQQKVKLARHHLATPADREEFAREGGQKIRTGKVLRPAGSTPGSSSRTPARAPGQRQPSWEEQASAVKRRAQKILGG